jgi:hypothetical protein
MSILHLTIKTIKTMDENTNTPFRMNQIKIPEMFYDSITGKPFTHCNVCNGPLMGGRIFAYVIEKVFRRSIVTGKMEVAFEYAICADCATKLVQSYSKESLERMQKYFHENINQYVNNADAPGFKDEQELKDHLSKCFFTGKSIEELDEYQVAAQFSGNHLGEMMSPYLFGGDAMDEVIDLLSEETLGEIDDFTGKYLSGPPEFRDMFTTPRRRPILI